MALLQTLGPFVQTLAPAAQYPNPYTIGPFTQPLTEAIVPPIPPGGGSYIRTPWCPPGTRWDALQQCCVPLEPATVPELDPHVARATAAAVGLVLEGPRGYQFLAAKLGLTVERARDDDDPE